MKNEVITGLPAHLAEQIKSELSRYPAICQAVLFGSRAMGTHRPNSDIDLCLDAPGLPFTDFLTLSAAMDERVLPYRLDLVLRHHIENPDLLTHIDQVGVTVYANAPSC
ncbi:MAG: nucleotidyltransferase domain-containing protein [Halomonas sp.]|nr:nucleotidyltransferase domain-containing protein [Halomonas sp.]TVM05667.1 MAG: nucleotidyltransferase domain-containing protein [Halomonas sp.]